MVCRSFGNKNDEDDQLQKKHIKRNYYVYSASGNRTPVSRMTGGDTYHYTNAERQAYKILNNKQPNKL